MRFINERAFSIYHANRCWVLFKETHHLNLAAWLFRFSPTSQKVEKRYPKLTQFDRTLFENLDHLFVGILSNHFRKLYARFGPLGFIGSLVWCSQGHDPASTIGNVFYVLIGAALSQNECLYKYKINSRYSSYIGQMYILTNKTSETMCYEDNWTINLISSTISIKFSLAKAGVRRRILTLFVDSRNPIKSPKRLEE